MAAINMQDNLLPRRYQEEVFGRAQEGNIIAALDTGSGKTFISTLLIKWVASLESSRNKVIVFLVPKVTLVEQQGDFISRQTPLRVIKLHGCLDLDMTDRKGWKKRFDNHDVFVMTAQIFINLLTHSHWSISKVSLMVFDECHHARKSHPYNAIMREYFQIPVSQRPKVFAMTASPIWNTKDPKASLATLESNMDAKVIGVREHLGELSEHAPKPIEIIKTYPPPSDAYAYPSPSLWDCLNSFYRWSDLDIPWSNIETKYNVTLNNLGPYCAELYLYNDLKHRIHQIISQRKPYIHGEVEMDLVSLSIAPSLSTEVLEIQAILSDFGPFFEHPSTPQATGLPIPIGLEWCSPKIKVLVDVLLAHYSPSFQGIVFVEQRQIATCLARVLPCIPEIKDIILTAELVGQAGTDDSISKGMGLRNQRDAVRLFREGAVNLLIATSVAEEGLDFPTCDIVVRFDPLQHMVGYVQSRGRARNKASKFVIMVQQDDAVHLARYRAFLESEPELKVAYQLRQDKGTYCEDNELEEEEEDHPFDLATRERYVVASTGAILTYDNSINLLNYLCSLIPTDSFTPTHVPKYRGDFEVVLQLPISLPLPPPDLVYKGPQKHSKREARRAAAFLAVKRLHELDVFDDFLLPVSSGRGKGDEDADARHISDVTQVPSKMDVMVRDPWTISRQLWVQAMHVDGRCVGGLVTGTPFPPVEMFWDGSVVEMHGAELVTFQEGEERRQRAMMREYTKTAIWYCITLRPLELPPSVHLLPLDAANRPDFETIQRLVDRPLGNYDWSGIREDQYLMIMNSSQIGQTLLLRRVRYDLTPMSAPEDGSREAGFATYRDYFLDRWAGRKGRIPHIATDGPLVEATRLPHQTWGGYSLHASSVDDTKVVEDSVVDVRLIPQGCCRWIAISKDIRRAYQALPPLCRRITDLYRVRQARIQLGLPAITDNFLVEAFTLPSANAPYNNQRLETLGDSVLKVCTTVHIFNKYPHRHEGQLDVLRQNSICNRTLLARAKEIGLEQFLISELQNVHDWRYTAPEPGGDDHDTQRPERYAHRQFPRRSLQDCMEATLGAAFLTGGIPMALRAGDALGLAFGGTRPWSLRYGRMPEGSSVPALFEKLQESLGYRFHESGHLVEAVTHPSFALSRGSSYQRLEFLGDAMIDLVVTRYLYDKFPQATSQQLSVARSRAICSQGLASVAVKRLELHKVMLLNNVELSIAISRYVPILKALSTEDVIEQGWKYDPPKAISDVLESVIGAILVDSAYNFEKVESVIEYVLGDVLSRLSTSLRPDPISVLMEWAASVGCRNICFRNTPSCPETGKAGGLVVLVHDTIIAGPMTASSLTVAKGHVSERALKILKDGSSDKCLSRICDCGKAMQVDPAEEK